MCADNAIEEVVEQPKRLSRLLRVGVVSIAVLIVLIAVAVFVLPNVGRLMSAQAALAGHATWLMGVRLAVIWLVWGYWDRLCEWLYANRSAEAKAYLMGRRHFFLGAFLTIELLLVQNLAGRLWDVLSGGSW
jgi:hypothetical protein